MPRARGDLGGRSRRSVIIFVKRPRLGGVKTRLAKGIGRLAALQFYRRTARRLIQRLSVRAGWRLCLAVSPDQFTSAGRIWPAAAGLEIVPQGGGDLGHRMARCLARCEGPALIVGSDIPDVRAGHIEQAFKALARADVAVGPAPDGGYWLIGLSGRGRGKVDRAAFRNVRWSGEHALADTLLSLPGRTVARLPVLADIDDGMALAAWREGRANGRDDS